MIDLGTYDADFAATWSNVADEQKEFVKESGWWNNGVRGDARSASKVTVAILIGVMLLVFFNIGALVASGLAVFGSPLFALILGFVVPFLTALAVYGSLVPSRTATGSALALRTESFRRFLASSEGKHVEWAWKHNVLREYSAWAVALGAADAWSHAISSSNIPDPSVAMSGPLLMHSMGSTFTSTHLAPSTSGGSGGGFSGGGFSGGGGGGGVPARGDRSHIGFGDREGVGTGHAASLS